MELSLIAYRTKATKRPNADFIFHDAKVIAELKLLKNPFGNKAFSVSLDRMKREWVRNRWITWKKLDQITLLRELPEKCRVQAKPEFIQTQLNLTLTIAD